MSGPGAAASTEGLPKQFVTSLRILFDILDEERSGYVRLGDIESRWHEEGVRGLPSGVIDSLRKVAPKTGRLNFETFVNGLKLSLLKNNAGGGNAGNSYPGKENKARPVSAPPKAVQPQTDAYKTSHGQRDAATGSSSQRNRQPAHRQLPQPSNTATVRPNNVLQSQNIELRNQIYSRDKQQQSSIRQHAKADPATYREQGRKTEHLVQKPRPKSVELHRTRDNNFTVARHIDIPTGRPERPPPYRPPDVATAGRPERPPPYRKQLEKEPPPAIPPRNMHGRIMQELKQWRQDHNLDFQGKIHTSQSDSKLVEKNNRNDIYGMKKGCSSAMANRVNSGQAPYGQTVQTLIRQLLQELPDLGQHRLQKGINMRLIEKILSECQTDWILTRHRVTRRLIWIQTVCKVNIDQIRQQAAILKKSAPASSTQGSPVRRQNSRRHTLSSGIDYNVIRRMKQLEKEKDELLQGLEVVDRAREWYMRQIAELTEKQNYADKTSCSDVTLQANQERMNFIRSRIVEVNLNLRSLMETTEKGFPAHMNLAMRSDTVSVDNSMKWMKDQNRQLTKEVGAKSEKITQLEKEKASLIRDLFEARSRHKTNYDDTTFM